MRQYTYYDETRQGFVKSNSPAEDKDLLKKFNSGSLMEDFFLHIRSLEIDKKWFGPRKAFVDGQQVEDAAYELLDTSKWFYAECKSCGWKGSSEKMEGGGPIADTGDYDDCICPRCQSKDIDDSGEIESYIGVVAIPVTEVETKKEWVNSELNKTHKEMQKKLDRLEELEVKVKEQELIIYGLEEGCEEWKSKCSDLEHSLEQDKLQYRVDRWLLACFGEEIARDKTERNHRFLEESLELVQSLGCTVSEAHQLVDYVFNRPLGEPHQEVGGVMVTLSALCLANNLAMELCGEAELSRVWNNIEKIREKQARKPKHSALPQAICKECDSNPVEKDGYVCNTCEAYRNQ